MSPTDPNSMATGSVGPDGTFSLGTLAERKRVPGVVPGEYTVAISLPQGANQAPPPAIRQSLTKVTVEPKDNYFEIEIEKK